MKQLRINELKMKLFSLFSLEEKLESFKESLKVSEIELENDNENPEIIESIQFFKRNVKKIENEISEEKLKINKHAKKAGFTSDRIKKIKDEARKEYSINNKNKLFNFYNVSSNNELKEFILKKDKEVEELIEFITFFNKQEK